MTRVPITVTTDPTTLKGSHCPNFRMSTRITIASGTTMRSAREKGPSCRHPNEIITLVGISEVPGILLVSLIFVSRRCLVFRRRLDRMKARKV